MEATITILAVVGMVALFVVMYSANRRFVKWLDERPLNLPADGDKKVEHR